MSDQVAFIDVRNIYIDYQMPKPWWQILGAKDSAYSALRNVSFQLNQGAKVLLYGKQASGKSTLMRALTGVLKPTKGKIIINGKKPEQVRHIAAGYVSVEEAEPSNDSCYQILIAFARTHDIANATARVGRVSDQLKMGEYVHKKAGSLSTTERLKLNVARAAVSESPLVLFDDAAEILGASFVGETLEKLFEGRTVVVATHSTSIADELRLPVMLLHNGGMGQIGTIDELAFSASCSRVVDVWIEGLRYDLLRKLRQHNGVVEARLIPSNQFAGQCLRVTLNSSRYLPSFYDFVSQAPLIQVREIPPSLNDVLARI